MAILRVRNEITLLREKWDVAILSVCEKITLLREKGGMDIQRERK
jgi:hypothetical protein